MMIPMIIFEDTSVLVLNKPTGLAMHYDGRTKEETLVDWLLERYPDIKNVGEPMVLQNGEVIERPGIVHRLDRDTSGVLIVAKTQDTFLHLKQQFHDRLAQKEYRAFVYGSVKEDTGTIDLPIGRQKSNPVLWSATRGAKGNLREAKTEYTTLARSPVASALALFPKTGRTHQLRVHCKAVNHPIICDPLYAPKREPLLGFTRLALHAFALTIALPTGTITRFESPLPDDFVHAYNAFAQEF